MVSVAGMSERLKTCWETKPLNVPSYKLFCKCPEDFKKSLDELCKNLNCVKNSYLGKIETAEMEISILNNDQNSRNSESNVIICKEITNLKKKINEIKCLGRKSQADGKIEFPNYSICIIERI